MDCGDFVSGLALGQPVPASGYPGQLAGISFGNATMDAYLRRLFGLQHPVLGGAYPVQVLIHAALQQLSLRSRTDREHQAFLMLGGFSAEDLAAGLINSMPQTLVYWAPLPDGPQPGEVRQAVARQRAGLPADGMCERIVCLDDAAGLPGELGARRCGSVVIASPGPLPRIDPWMGYLDARCSVIRASGTAMPSPLGWTTRREATLSPPPGWGLPGTLFIALDERAP